MELTQREVEGKDLRRIHHPGHDHPLVLIEPLQGHGGGPVEIYCHGCNERNSSSSSTSSSGARGGGGAFYKCLRSRCWYFLHKRCAELPPKIKHPSHPEHALTLSPFPLGNHGCDLCSSYLDGFLYSCSDCGFNVHVRCASMALRIQDRVDENIKIHQHPLIPLEKEGKDLRIIEHQMHDHPLVLRESLQGDDRYGGGGFPVKCNGCRELISSALSSSGVGGGAGPFYTCRNSNCWFLLHKRCAELPPKIEHPYHLEHALTLSPAPLYSRICNVCEFTIDGFLYCCSDCDFDVHERCPTMARHIQDRVTGSHIIEHPCHDHPLVLSESLQGHSVYGGGRQRVYCDGCKEPISFSSSGAKGGRDAIYSCTNSDCWYLLHKGCAELPPKIKHPSHPDHALTLRHQASHMMCDVCKSYVKGFEYCCSHCKFRVHVPCASMALHIQDSVDENYKIHEHPLIPIEMEAQFLCTVCGREHKGKSYLCHTCGFWANRICVSTPTKVDLRSHPHPLTLLRSVPYDNVRRCEICNEKVMTARWAYCCSKKCYYWVHVDCWLSLEEAENSNKDIQTNFRVTWPLPDESPHVITQLIKNFSCQGTHKRVTKIPRCKKFHSMIFVNKKIDESKDDQLCGGCEQTISSQFYHCAQCNFSLHKWCGELPNELQHIFHPEHSLHLLTHQFTHKIGCSGCLMEINGTAFGCFSCDYYLDLKCASLPRIINHRGHDHTLTLKSVIIEHTVGYKVTSTTMGTTSIRCNACGGDSPAYFQCDACNFGLCSIKCALLPSSVRHRYDKHSFTLFYSPIKGQPNEYYCEICEEDIDLRYWFYHCIECDQSLHPKCIYPDLYQSKFSFL